MSEQPMRRHPLEDSEARLEEAPVAEYLRSRGHDSSSIASLPEPERQRLLRDACQYAAAKLTEVEARAHLSTSCTASPEDRVARAAQTLPGVAPVGTLALSSSSNSIGSGKMIVEFFSAAISVSVCR